MGHYERFTHAKISKKCNHTTGSIYNSVITKERRGDYLGGTVQIIPHVTDEIKQAITNVVDGSDLAIVEIGGTVGDIESLPFLEAIRQFRNDVGKENCLYVHLTLVPYIKSAGELKTKPPNTRYPSSGGWASSRTSCSAAPRCPWTAASRKKSPYSATWSPRR